MKRPLLRGAAAMALALAFLCTLPTWAQTPPRLIVTTPPGGGLDALGRTLAAGMARVGGEGMIVENRPGAGGLIGADHVAKAAPDGRTLLLATGFVALTTVVNKAPYDALRDFVPVIDLPTLHQILIARAGAGIHSPADLPRVAAATRGGLNCAGFVGEPHWRASCCAISWVVPQ